MHLMQSSGPHSVDISLPPEWRWQYLGVILGGDGRFVSESETECNCEMRMSRAAALYLTFPSESNARRPC